MPRSVIASDALDAHVALLLVLVVVSALELVVVVVQRISQRLSRKVAISLVAHLLTSMLDRQSLRPAARRGLSDLEQIESSMSAQHSRLG